MLSTHIIALANQKGGVGKTTSCVNLAASLAVTKRRVLLVDLDPQGNATTGCGIDKHAVHATMHAVIMGQVPLIEARIHVSQGFDVLPANADLTAAQVALLDTGKPTAHRGPSPQQGRLRTLLHAVRAQYDYILIDCPPSLNMLTVNALVAANAVLIPVQCEYYALEGLAALLKTINQLSQTLNPDLRIEGVLRTMYDGRNKLSREVSEQLLAHFGQQTYRTIIPRNVRLAEAPSHGVPIFYYDARSQGAASYLALAGEMIQRHGLPDHPALAAEAEGLVHPMAVHAVGGPRL